MKEEEKIGGLWLGGDKVFAASVQGANLKVAVEPGWQQWFSNVESPKVKFQHTIERLSMKLASNTAKTQGDGKGVGKSKGKVKGRNQRDASGHASR